MTTYYVEKTLHLKFPKSRKTKLSMIATVFDRSSLSGVYAKFRTADEAGEFILIDEKEHVRSSCEVAQPTFRIIQSDKLTRRHRNELARKSAAYVYRANAYPGFSIVNYKEWKIEAEDHAVAA